jgi:MoxR-like ATPase
VTISAEQATRFQAAFVTMAESIGKAVLGKDHVVRLTLTCLVSEGHLLLEDLPGTGKTMLARRLANTSRGRTRASSSRRPAAHDVTGVTVYDQHQGTSSSSTRPDLPRHRAGRRDQPGLAQDPVGAARGDGGGHVTVDASPTTCPGRSW